MAYFAGRVEDAFSVHKVALQNTTPGRKFYHFKYNKKCQSPRIYIKGACKMLKCGINI